MRLNVKLMKRPPELTDDEISKYMDFDRVIEKRNAILRVRRYYRAGFVLAGAILTGTLLYVLVSSRQNINTTVSPDKISTQTPLVVADSTENVQSLEPVKSDSTPNQVVQTPAKKQKPGNKEEVDRSEDVYLQAEPIHGYDSLFAYFRNNLSYPAEAVKDSIHGVLTISFVINKQGTIQNVSFPKTLGAPFEKEALKLIEKMPPWKPATLNGVPVLSKVSLPLTFELVKIK